MTDVLLTNDDGFGAHGLAVATELLARALPSARVWTVVPRTDRSGGSHAVSLRGSIGVERVGPRTIVVDGTAADCVVLAGHGLVPRPDLVVAGVNGGPNLGDDLHYSATTSAAAEAALQGIPALAVSLAWSFDDPGRGRGWPAVLMVGVPFLAGLAAAEAPAVSRFWNLNVPDVDVARLRGLRRCPLGRRRAEISLTREAGEAAGERWRIRAAHRGHAGPPGCDLELVAAGFATVSAVGLEPVDGGDAPWLEALIDPSRDPLLDPSRDPSAPARPVAAGWSA
ncbi:MAG: 5'/3'-nucleotidase SurE [Kineosporiaceae bacterium]